MKGIDASRLYEEAAKVEYSLSAMPKMIHYQDDLFFLSVQVKSLDTVLSTEADPEYFRDRIVGDLGFLDGALRSFGSMLAQNALLIDRPEYLKLLERTVRSFAGILDKLLSSEYPRAEAFGAFAPRIREALASQKGLLAELDGQLSSSLSGEAETDHVSQDELSGLLAEDGQEGS
jgi:hypothetical protein